MSRPTERLAWAGPPEAAFIGAVGARVRALREAQGVSRRMLSERSGVSQRYLAQLEGGGGNISIALLYRIARALGTQVAGLVADGPTGPEPARAQRICLIGLRGAGKSTLGRMAGKVLKLPFRELNAEIAKESGMRVADLIALYGPEGYRKLERQALERIAGATGRVILAAAGGIVADPETYAFLLARFHTIWLRAAPREHMDRVRAQGDERPMAGNPKAMEDLVGILISREALYAQAGHRVDTSGRTPEESLEDVLAAIEQMGCLASEAAE